MSENNGVNKLAQVLQKRMHEVSTPERLLDFGTITAGLGLQLDNFPQVFPIGDYKVCRDLTLTTQQTLTTVAASGHTHSVNVPSDNKGLVAGDRVLAVWVDSDVVIIDVIV